MKREILYQLKSKKQYLTSFYYPSARHHNVFNTKYPQKKQN